MNRLVSVNVFSNFFFYYIPTTGEEGGLSKDYGSNKFKKNVGTRDHKGRDGSEDPKKWPRG